MLRTITSEQLYELIDYAELEPSGEERMDLRFALLASACVGAAGGTAAGGGPYTPMNFLKALTRDDDEVKSAPPKQTPAQMEMLLLDWCNAANQIHLENQRARRSRRANRT